MLQLRGVEGPTSRLLVEMLKERDLTSKPIKGVVNYGYAEASGLPTLNAGAGKMNKYEELVEISEAGIPTVPFARSAADLVAPIFGRKFHHTRGNDIQIYQVRPLLRGDRLSDYYTQQIEKKTEYRVWAFRGKYLATYQKVLEYPAKNGKRGRSKLIWNWRNGYAYQFCRPEDVRDGIKNIGVDSVEALGLDFGAVDVIEGTNKKLYVLEVNTAPGTQGAARQGITSLVNCIEKWARKGFPSQ